MEQFVDNNKQIHYSKYKEQMEMMPMGGSGASSKFGERTNQERKEEMKENIYNDYSEKEEGWENEHFNDQAQDWIKSLTPDEKWKGISLYTSDGYVAMNQFLRADSEEKRQQLLSRYKNLEQYIKNCEDAINKFDLKENLLVYRGANAGLLSGLGITYNGDNNAFMNSVNQNIGSVVQDKAFTSTSTRKYMADEAPIRYEIRVPKGTSAAYVSHISGRAEERELLLNRGTKFKVVSAHMDGNKPVVVLEVTKK